MRVAETICPGTAPSAFGEVYGFPRGRQERQDSLACRRGVRSGHGGVDKKASAGMHADDPQQARRLADQSNEAGAVSMDRVGRGKVWIHTSSKF